MPCGDKVGIEHVGCFKQSGPFDFFVADNAGVRGSCSKIFFLKIADDILTEPLAEVEGVDGDTELFTVADDEGRGLQCGAAFGGVEHLDVKPITRYPSSTSMHAATAESTPPEMPTRTVVSCFIVFS